MKGSEKVGRPSKFWHVSTLQ